jgi:hypothetical protein
VQLAQLLMKPSAPVKCDICCVQWRGYNEGCAVPLCARCMLPASQLCPRHNRLLTLYEYTGGISLTVLHPEHHCFSWIATRLWHGQTGVRTSVKEREVSLLQNVQTHSGTHPGSCSIGTGFFPEGKSGRSVMFTTHLHIVPRLRQCSYTSNSPVRLCGVDWDNFTFNLFL